MALSLNYPILANEIASAQALGDGHPVWGLVGFDNDLVVIKQERVSGRLSKTDNNPHPGRKEALSTNLNLMHSVDPDAKIVVLNRDEVHAISEFVEFQREFAKATNTPVPPVMQNLSNRLRTELSGDVKWVKMGFKQLTNVERAGLDRMIGNKTGVRQFVAALNAPGGLEKLGEIIAVDLFNDNHDRFSVKSGGFFNQIPLRFMVNLGNVLLSSGQVSGLDSWDPNSPIKVTRQNLNNQDRDNEWGGYLLGPDAAVTINSNTGRKVITKSAFAEGVIADLEFVLGPRDRKFFLLRKQRLSIDAKRRLKQGMTSGAAKIRDHLRGLNALPVLLQDKVIALGWNPL